MTIGIISVLGCVNICIHLEAKRYGHDIDSIEQEMDAVLVPARVNFCSSQGGVWLGHGGYSGTPHIIF